MAEPESLRQVAHSPAPLSTWLGIVLLFALFGVIVLAVIGPAPRGSDYEETRAKKRAEILKTTRDEAAKALTTYGWIDKNKGVAHIPIAHAMELTVAKLAQQKPAPAGPIATPEPQAPAARPGAAASLASPQASATPKAATIGAGPESENRAQPAGAANPPSVQPSTQPGPSATPAASPPASGQAPVSPSPQASQSPPGTPLPVPGKTP